MAYSITYYNSAVQTDISTLPETLIARFFALTDRMVHSGANLGHPHTQAMGDGLFELRLKGSEGIARVFYCTLVGKRIVMLHSFIKKTQKTPLRELRMAQSRMKEVKDAHA
jgi:phage-related protein